MTTDEGIFPLSALLEMDIKPSPPIIEGLLWDKDNVLIVGHEKAGKSILALQIAFAITSGQPLFGEFPVINPSTVLYVQTEGKRGQTVERTKEMLRVNDCDTNRLYLAYYPHLALDTPGGMEMFRMDIDKAQVKPNVIIIDPLYHAMAGSLTDEESARHMTSNLRTIMERYQCAIIVVHHTHKPIRSQNGQLISEGDGAIFGSFVWKSWADHTLLFRMDKSKLRILSCDTQRSGKVIDYEELKLTSGPYLGFDRTRDELAQYEIGIRKAIEEAQDRGMTRQALEEKTKFSISTIEKSLRKLIEIGEVVKDTKVRPVIYWSKLHVPKVTGTGVATEPTQTSSVSSV